MSNAFCKIFLVLFGVLSGLFLFCAADAYFFGDYPGIDFDINTVSSNKTLGYELKKNCHISGIKTNSAGFRDKEFELLKNNRSRRILVLGDSLTFAVNIAEQKDIFTYRLEKLLNSETDVFDYEVLNMGVDGYNTVQEAENLKYNGIKYKPDMVIVVYCLNDDYKKYNEIYYASFFNENRINRFLFRSAAYRKIYFFIADSLWLIKTNGKMQGIDGKYSSLNFEETGFAMFRDLQKKYNFKLYFFIVPYFKDFNNYEDISLHNKTAERLSRYGIGYFDLLKDFSKVTKNGKIFRHNNPNDFCHPNEKGHELIAEFIYKKIKQDGVFD